MTKVAIPPVAVPTMVVVEASAVAFPIPFKKHLPIVARSDPARAGVGRPGPVTIMPSVAVPGRVPVTIHPEEVRSRSPWPDANYTGPRRRADSDSDRYLTERHSYRQQHGCE